MGSHRRARTRTGRRPRAPLLAGALLLAGAVVLALAVVRADLTVPPGAAAPAPVPPTGAAPVPGAFAGTWTGALADPDTTTVDVRVTVGGAARGTVVEIPALGCTYRGPDPVSTPGDRPYATTEVRADDPGPRCLDAARIRLGPAAPGSGADRLRYELLGSCEGGVCIPRRASAVLTPSRPGP